MTFKKKFLSGLKEIIVATTPEDWFEYLSKNGVKKLTIIHQSDSSQAPDYKLAGFVGGGGSWLIEAKKINTSDIWQSRWATKPDSERKNNDKNIWNIDYGQVMSNVPHHSFLNKDITNQKKELKEVLTQISEFANSHEDTKFWAENYFDKAIESLTSENPIGDYYHKDLVPANSISIECLQLLMAACKAFVFGGMGSWNDIGFDDKEINDKYEELSAKLYSVMNESIVIAVNSGV